MHYFDSNIWNNNPYHGNDMIVADWYDKKCSRIKLMDWKTIPDFAYSTIIDKFKPYIDAINTDNNVLYDKALSFAIQIILPAYLHFTISKETLWLVNKKESDNLRSKQLLDHNIAIFTIVGIGDEIVSALINSETINTNQLTYKIGYIRNKLCNLTLENNIDSVDYNIISKKITCINGNSLPYTEQGRALADLELRRHYNIVKKYFNNDYSMWSLSESWVDLIIKQTHANLVENYNNMTGHSGIQLKAIGNHHHYHLFEIIETAKKCYNKLLFSLMVKPHVATNEILYSYIKLYRFKNIIARISQNSDMWDGNRTGKNSIMGYEVINPWNKAYGNVIDKLTSNWANIKPLNDLLDHNKNILENKIKKYGLYGHMNQYSFGDQFENILIFTALSNINNVQNSLSKVESYQDNIKINIKLSLATVDFCMTEIHTENAYYGY